jgi:hypothetical protein
MVISTKKKNGSRTKTKTKFGNRKKSLKGGMSMPKFFKKKIKPVSYEKRVTVTNPLFKLTEPERQYKKGLRAYGPIKPNTVNGVNTKEIFSTLKLNSSQKPKPVSNNNGFNKLASKSERYKTTPLYKAILEKAKAEKINLSEVGEISTKQPSTNLNPPQKIQTVINAIKGNYEIPVS